MSRDYLDLYQDGNAISGGATTVGNSGLGMNASERASVPAYPSRKKKKRMASQKPKTGNLGPDALAQPSMMNKAPDP